MMPDNAILYRDLVAWLFSLMIVSQAPHTKRLTRLDKHTDVLVQWCNDVSRARECVVMWLFYILPATNLSWILCEWVVIHNYNDMELLSWERNQLLCPCVKNWVFSNLTCKMPVTRPWIYSPHNTPGQHQRNFPFEVYNRIWYQILLVCRSQSIRNNVSRMQVITLICGMDKGWRTRQ